MLESERRDLAFVPRWSIIRTIHKQSVAEHSYFVVAYGLWLAEQLGWNGDYRLLATYLVRHDEDEAISSDIPGPIKRVCGFDEKKLATLASLRFGEPLRVDYQMMAIRKLADLIDEVLYLCGEQAMGNKWVDSSLANAWARFRSKIDEYITDESLAKHILTCVYQAGVREQAGNKSLRGLEN